MDDMILIGLTREECNQSKQAIERYLSDELKLSLSKAAIQKIRKGVNFVGYRTWRSHRYIRKYSLYKFRKALKRRDRDVIVSLLGHAKRTSSHSYMLNMLREHCYEIYLSLHPCR